MYVLGLVNRNINTGGGTILPDRRLAGLDRYRKDFEAGRVGNTVHSRSGLNLAPYRPQKIFQRQRDIVLSLRRRGYSLRWIARSMGIGLGSVTRALRKVANEAEN